MADCTNCMHLCWVDSLVFPSGKRLVDLTAMDLEQAVEWRTRWQAASVVPTLQAIRRRKSELAVTTPEIVTAISEVGFHGVDFLGTLRLYYAVDIDGTPGERQIKRHEGFDLRCVVAIPQSLSVVNRQDASFQFRVIPTYRSGLEPVTPIGEQALLTAIESDDLWTLGPAQIGGQWIDNIDGWSLSLNAEVTERNKNGETQDCYVKVGRTNPELSISGPGCSWFRTYLMEGGQAAGAKFFLRRQNPRGDVFPNSDRVHAYLELLSGTYVPTRRSGGIGTPAETTLVIRPEQVEGGAYFIRLVTGQPIA